MSEHPRDEAPAARGGWLRWAIIALAAVGVGAVLYVIASAMFKPGGADLQRFATGPLQKMTVADRPLPATLVTGPDGAPVRIADLKGQVLVVNLWATWCPPCVKEMPTLARLQDAYAGRPVRVIPVSVDKPEDQEKARAFIAAHPPLQFHSDPKYALPFSLDPVAEGFPTTVIVGRDGREKARLSGEAAWDSPEARRLIDALVSGG